MKKFVVNRIIYGGQYTYVQDIIIMGEYNTFEDAAKNCIKLQKANPRHTYKIEV